MSNLGADSAPGKIRIESVKHFTENNTAEISNLVVEINIHSDINYGSSFAELTISDFVNYMLNGNINSGDSFSITIGYQDTSITYKYKLAKIQDIKNFQNGKSYNLKLISELEYFSIFRKISKSFSGRTSDMAFQVFLENTDENGGLWEPSAGIQTVCVPNWSPMQTINWFAKRSKSLNSPGKFLFFQNSKQEWNFCSLEAYWSHEQDPVIEYRYAANNLGKNNNLGTVPNSEATMRTIFQLDFLNVFDLRKAYDDGVIRNTKIRTDFTTKTIDFQHNSYWDTYNTRSLNARNLWPFENSSPGKLVYENTAWESVPSLGFNKVSDEVVANPAYDKTQMVEIVVVGNPYVDVGMAVDIKIPSPEAESTVKEVEFDELWSGKYYVISKRDMMDRTGHKMALRLAKGSRI